MSIPKLQSARPKATHTTIAVPLLVGTRTVRTASLPTEFGVLKVGDRRLGKKQVVEAARKKLRAMGRHAAADMRDDVGTLKLNVTTLDGSLAGSTRQQLSGRGLSRG